MVAHHATDVFWHRLEVGNQFTRAFFLKLWFAGDGGIDVGDVSRVVLGVMDFHCAGVDVGFERVVCVSEFGTGVGHGRVGWG